MAGLASLSPGSALVVLHSMAALNPARSAAEWTESELAKHCAELCGKPCTRQMMGMSLRSALLCKGLVVSHKAGRKLLLWAPSAEARTPAARASRTCAQRAFTRPRRRAWPPPG